MTVRGISTIELMVALAVMTMAITASTLIAMSTPRIIADANNTAVALEEVYEALRNGVGSTTPLEDERFMRMTAQANWTSSNAVLRTTQLSTVVSTSTEPSACDAFTSGDWSEPKLMHSYALKEDFLPTYPGTFTISSLAISPGVLAVGIASTSVPSAPTALFYSLVSTSTPRLMGAFDIARTSRIGSSAIAATANYFFVGNAFSSASTVTCADDSSCSNVAVYISNNSIMGRVSSLTLATSSAPFAYSSDGSPSPTSSLAYYRGYLYLGIQKTVRGSELNVIDARDPAHLRWVSGYSIGRTVNQISVRGRYAYVSTDDPERELMVFDTSDPNHLILRATWNAPGSATFGYGSGNTAYEDSIRFGRTYTASGPEFELLKMPNGEAITEVEHLDSGTSKDPESVRALLTQDRLTFLLLTHRLDILDTHDSAHAQLIGTYPLPLGTHGVALTCRNNQIYLAGNSDNGNGYLQILQGS